MEVTERDRALRKKREELARIQERLRAPDLHPRHCARIEETPNNS
jgi:hypothetical protein